MAEGERIYLDYHSTTPVDPRVVEAMEPYWSRRFGNAASRQHSFGLEAEAAVRQARAAVARAVGADAEEIVFTSGATEADNLALAGFLRCAGKPSGLVTVATEHPAVLETARALKAEGFEVTVLPVRGDGLLDLGELEAALAKGPERKLVSVMAVNNEIGVVQPLEEIGAICAARGAVLHTDAAQAIGRVALDARSMGLGMASLSAHKCYGPKGVGALFVSRYRPRVKLAPLLHGGGQEVGLRSGTLPVALIVGFARAVEIALAEGPAEELRLRGLRERLREGLIRRLGGGCVVRVNGSLERRVGGNLNVSFEGVEGEALLTMLNERGIGVSTGSACATAGQEAEGSHVLKALGLSEPEVAGSVRFGLGRWTTEWEIDRAIEAVAWGVERLRRLSPL